MEALERLLMATNSSTVDLFNFSLKQARIVLTEHMLQEEVFGPATGGIIFACYVLLMTVGAFSNLLVSCVIISNVKVRTTRNLFVFNLNMSDLALCVFCMPFTLVELIWRSWSLGPVLCKLVPFVQGSTIFVSSATVSAIAIDRYKAILSYNTQKSQRGTWYIAVYTLLIWVLSLVLSLPICFSQTVTSVGLSGMVFYEKCVEKWSSPYGKGAYTVFILATQFVIPTTVLLITHSRIKIHLNSSVFQQNGQGESEKASERLNRELRRNRRATMVLLVISVFFSISWLPWNVLNLIADFHPTGMSPQSLYLAFAVCHIVAMTSAITNPILYGWLNSNIRRELTRVGAAVAKVGTVILSYRTSNSDNVPVQYGNTQSQTSLREADTQKGECRV